MKNIKRHTIFGITITDITISQAVQLINDLIKEFKNKSNAIFFINTNTLNLSIADKAYRNIINSAEYVFGDGTGVRWAIRFLHNTKLQDNVNGTDLIPLFMKETSKKKYRCYLLGATADEIGKASNFVKDNFPGWEVAGFHHGYLTDLDNKNVINQINKSKAHLLLVGMGNPLQEKWIIGNRSKLNIPIMAGVGGLFTYWAGNLERAPLWMRKIGIEWLHILISQPGKNGNDIYSAICFFYSGLEKKL